MKTGSEFILINRIPRGFHFQHCWCILLLEEHVFVGSQESKHWPNSCIGNSWRTEPMSHTSFYFVQQSVHRLSVETSGWISHESERHTEIQGDCPLLTQSEDRHWAGLARSCRALLSAFSLVSFIFSILNLVFVFETVGNEKARFWILYHPSPHPT